jgi:hypothetical protein
MHLAFLHSAMGRALVALGLALVALALAYASAHKPTKTHAFVCTPPPDILPGLRQSKLARTDTCLTNRGTPWPTNQANVTLNRPRLHTYCDSRRQERILAEFFSALLDADDLALLERETQAMGVAYLDTNFSMCRRPLLLRSSVRYLMQKYSLPTIPLERKWTPVTTEYLP